jgi:hypothetical protein
MEARKGGRAYVKKPETGLGFAKPKSAQNASKGGNQPNKKGGQGQPNNAAAAGANGTKKGSPNGNPKNEGNGHAPALKKSKDGQPATAAAPAAAAQKEEEPEEEEEATCLICCEPIDYFSMGECEHRFVCSQCTLLRRGLYRELHCCICKVPIQSRDVAPFALVVGELVH